MLAIDFKLVYFLIKITLYFIPLLVISNFKFSSFLYVEKEINSLTSIAASGLESSLLESRLRFCSLGRRLGPVSQRYGLRLERLYFIMFA